MEDEYEKRLDRLQRLGQANGTSESSIRAARRTCDDDDSDTRIDSMVGQCFVCHR